MRKNVMSEVECVNIMIDQMRSNTISDIRDIIRGMRRLQGEDSRLMAVKEVIDVLSFIYEDTAYQDLVLVWKRAIKPLEKDVENDINLKYLNKMILGGKFNDSTIW